MPPRPRCRVTTREVTSGSTATVFFLLELDGFHVKSNVIRAIVVRRRHRVRYYVIRDVFYIYIYIYIYKYFDAIDLRYYVIREAIVI